MPKIKDRATICWVDKKGKRINEEVVTYELDEEDEVDETISSESASVLPYDTIEQFPDIHPFHRIFVTMILEDFLEKLGILRCTAQGSHRPLGIRYPEYKTLDERYGQVIFEEDQYTESKKRYTDLNMIYSVIFRTVEQMNKIGSYAALTEATKIMKKLFEDDERLIVEEEESRGEEEQLRNQQRLLKKELENSYNAKLEELRQLEDKLEDAIAYGKLEYAYLQNWEAARLHQAKMIQENAENNFRDIISANRTKLELENRIHGELVKFFNENEEELSNETSYWMYRYETEMESRESELVKLRIDREAQMEKYMQLKATYELQKDFIEHVNKRKEEKQIAEKILNLKTHAAVIIQTWWRRTMQRLKIGPYGRKKGKGKRKEKGKKK